MALKFQPVCLEVPVGRNSLVIPVDSPIRGWTYLQIHTVSTLQEQTTPTRFEIKFNARSVSGILWPGCPFGRGCPGLRGVL